MIERRNSIRYPASTIEYQCVIGTKKCRNICKDISLTGVRIPEKVKKGEKISFHLFFYPNTKPFYINGHCVRGIDKNSGIQFTKSKVHKPTFTQIKSFINEAHDFKKYDFPSLLRRFTVKNQKSINYVISTFLKILYFRQYSLKKPILKSKSIIQVLDFSKDYISKFRPVSIDGNLGQLMGFGKMTEDRALEYYCNDVRGEVQDIYGRSISLGDEVFDSLFKDPKTGKKIKKTENFEQSRAKRLPWIKYVLSKTSQIYEVNEENWMTYYYTMPFDIKYFDNQENETKKKTDHYLIVTKKKAGEKIKFVTAYVPDGRIDLFKKICRGSPYHHQQG